MGKENQCDHGFQWGFSLMAFVCLAAFISGGSHAFGRPLSESDDPPQQGLRLPPPASAADFSLSSFPTSPVRWMGYGAEPTYGALQEQPFVEKSVRLRDDDPEYNKRFPVWSVALRVLLQNVLTWTVDRFIFNYSYSHIGPTSWKHNLQTGWEWDTDRFGMNFFFHPYTGGEYFMSARANGYNFYESLPFSFLGSLTWEYLGETTRPSYNDIINTTVSGAFFGEILYRLSSNLLDDRTTGTERFFRELGAAILSPGRAMSRLLQRKMWRVTSKEIYQKEPLNVSLYAGAHWLNKGSSFGTGSTSALFNIQCDYGDPFENRDRKPYDFFKVRMDLSYGKNVGNKFLTSVVGYGLLFGKTIHFGNLDMLIGAFQHYNFWDSKIFEIGILGFGGGIITKWKWSANTNLQTAFHLGVVPLGASNSPDIDIVEAGIHGRNYDYSGGGEAKFESTLNLANRGQLTVIYYYYRLYTYVGTSGNKNIEIFRPRIAVRLFSNLSLGFEYAWYHKDSFVRNLPDVRISNSEQKIYLMLYF